MQQYIINILVILQPIYLKIADFSLRAKYGPKCA